MIFDNTYEWIYYDVGLSGCQLSSLCFDFGSFVINYSNIKRNIKRMLRSTGEKSDQDKRKFLSVLLWFFAVFMFGQEK